MNLQMKLSMLSSVARTAHIEAFSKLLVAAFAPIRGNTAAWSKVQIRRGIKTHVVAHYGGIETHLQIL